MPRFFIENIKSDSLTIDGPDAIHISRSLRMQKGDILTICDTKSTDYKCKITDINNDYVKLNVIEKYPCHNEPNINVTLYQAIPKSDKMDQIIQKSVELGVSSVVPVLMDRCISRPRDFAMAKKIKRWQKISQSAAEQSSRGIIPKISDTINIDQAIERSAKNDLSIFFYEDGGETISHILTTPKKLETMSIFIGPEGGFSLDEVNKLTINGISPVTLGERILRTETAPIAALAIIMYITGNMN